MIQTVPADHVIQWHDPNANRPPLQVAKGDPLWWAVLKKYRSFYGQGLSPQALIHLTGQSWDVMRKEIHDMLGGKEPSLYVMYCDTVNAMVIKCIPGMNYAGYYREDRGYHLAQAMEDLDASVEQFPPTKYVGVRNKTGQEKLTVRNYPEVDVPKKLREYVEYVRAL